MRIWRISNYSDLSGRGGVTADGRWNWRGTPIVYCADHPSTALLEVLVHFDAETFPEHYQLIAIDVPDSVSRHEPALPEGWRDDVIMSRDLGTRLFRENNYALFSVPSIVMPEARNYLVNPGHPDAEAMTVLATYRYPFDSRLLK
jgi:RES domain-containing protein